MISYPGVEFNDLEPDNLYVWPEAPGISRIKTYFEVIGAKKVEDLMGEMTEGWRTIFYVINWETLTLYEKRTNFTMYDHMFVRGVRRIGGKTGNGALEKIREIAAIFEL